MIDRIEAALVSIKALTAEDFENASGMSNPIVLNQATRRDHMKEVQTPYLAIEWLKGKLEEGTGLSKDKVEEVLKVIREECFELVEVELWNY